MQGTVRMRNARGSRRPPPRPRPQPGVPASGEGGGAQGACAWPGRALAEGRRRGARGGQPAEAESRAGGRSVRREPVGTDSYGLTIVGITFLYSTISGALGGRFKTWRWLDCWNLESPKCLYLHTGWGKNLIYIHCDQLSHNLPDPDPGFRVTRPLPRRRL
ncbi:dual specificity protein phosphatase 14 isoform X4 [Myotis daubentonii]|uniref:dual specificity protein phosphatase 14 isoform X4 n=1 Tax=Myotis daubentonii TaxID=98922 RepID=UPI0028730D71|nr:dual specificity protein phosphatase 14 isoform X4 [Myotis daubentonii]